MQGFSYYRRTGDYPEQNLMKSDPKCLYISIFILFLSLPDMLQLLGLLRLDINENLRKLVVSFEFSASNVVLKPKEWTLVALILIKM